MIIVDTTVIIDLWQGGRGIKVCLAKKFFILAITIEEIYDGLGYIKKKKGIHWV